MRSRLSFYSLARLENDDFHLKLKRLFFPNSSEKIKLSNAAREHIFALALLHNPPGDMDIRYDSGHRATPSELSWQILG